MANVTQSTAVGTAAAVRSEFDAKARSQSSIIFGRFVRHRAAMISLGLLLLLVLAAFLVPPLLPYNYQDTSSGGFLKPGGGHLLGTDQLGRDTLAQLLRGTQFSLAIAFTVAISSTVVGVVIGAVAGYLKGFLDNALMRLVDLFLIVPQIALAAILVHAWSSTWWVVSIVLALFNWMSIARITRGEALSLSAREFIEASRAAGAGTWHIVFKHLIPNMVGTITVNATLSVSTAVLTEAALSFIGLGVQLPDTSLGLIVNDNYTQVLLRPWLFWGPFLAIVLISMTISFIGDGLRDAFDPRQTKVRA
ncbi:ABC transporter permease [Kutzneria buriramensis]|uniref:Oligopeptide transport system permease protein OppC n=1 Tax=Kutzneria buriramensis TaxID=1045776 RepID=A0A3E0HCG7_9PSEU|nr:peptide/nickel transport system permease protein [Kutzneria buriramensis]